MRKFSKGMDVAASLKNKDAFNMKRNKIGVGD